MWLCVDMRMDTNHICIVCLKDIGLRPQNMVTILGSIVNMIGRGGDLYYCFTSSRIFTLIMNKIFIRAPIFMTWQMVTGTIQICYIVSHKSHVSYPMRSGHREWHVVRCGSRNEHQTYIMCLKEIGWRAWTMPTTLSAQQPTWLGGRGGGTYTTT